MLGWKVGATTAAVLAALSLAGTGALAAETKGTKDLRSYVCTDVMRMSGEDRQIALAIVHGYALGKKGTTRFDVDALAQITDKFVEYCLDHPAENALESFEKIAR